MGERDIEKREREREREEMEIAFAVVWMFNQLPQPQLQFCNFVIKPSFPQIGHKSTNI
jgi:hypothetical protein